jgi:hypothetical protein
MIFFSNRLKNFVKQLFPSPSRRETEGAGERVFQRLREEFPDRVDEFRFQARPNSLPELDRFERTVLQAVYMTRRGDTDCIQDRVLLLVRGKRFPNCRHYGVFDVLTCLDRLGLVAGKVIEGRRDYHRYWTITPLGARVLAKKSVWQRASERVMDYA